MSRGEFDSVKRAVGGWETLLDTNSKYKDELVLIQYLSQEEAQEKLLESPKLFKTPIVRNKKLATVGYSSDVWKTWE